MWVQRWESELYRIYVWINHSGGRFPMEEFKTSKGGQLSNQQCLRHLCPLYPVCTPLPHWCKHHHQCSSLGTSDWEEYGLRVKGPGQDQVQIPLDKVIVTPSGHFGKAPFKKCGLSGNTKAWKAESGTQVSP